MAIPRKPKKVKMIVGLISGDEALFAETKKLLEKILGKVDYESPAMGFAHTEYYENEMGCGLKRKFFSFERLCGLKSIYDLKLKTNNLEQKFLEGGRRKVNIDPGYLDLGKLVLFSTKDYSHRIYLDKGIFAEVTLYYKDKSFNPWPWTYPDYKTRPYIDIFNSIREKYKNDLQGMSRLI